MTSARVLVVGNTTVDHVLSVAGLLIPDTKINAQAYEVYAGGQGANVAAGLALLGFEVSFLGKFGDDAGATLNRCSFAGLGVNLSLSSTVEGCRHHFACIVVSGEQRTIAMYRDSRLSLDDVAISADTVAPFAAVYTDGHEGRASLRVSAEAKNAGIPVVTDMETVAAYSMELVANSDHLVAPLGIIQELGGSSDMADAMRFILGRGPSTVVATMGSQGSAGLTVESKAPDFAPAVACDVVDTTGAGDAYHAGYLAGLLRGEPLAERLRFASALASAKCGIHGPRLTPAYRESMRPAPR